MQAFCLPFHSSFFYLPIPFCCFFLSFCILQVLIMLFIFYLLDSLQFLYICTISFCTKNFVFYLPLKKSINSGIVNIFSCLYIFITSQGQGCSLYSYKFLLFSLLLFFLLLFLRSILSVCLKQVLTLWPGLTFTLPVDPNQDSSSW